MLSPSTAVICATRFQGEAGLRVASASVTFATRAFREPFSVIWLAPSRRSTNLGSGFLSRAGPRCKCTFCGTTFCIEPEFHWIRSTPTEIESSSKALLEPGFQKSTEFSRRPELRNRIQVLERRSEGVRRPPYCPRFEFVVQRIEIQIVHTTPQMPRNLQFAFDERRR